MKTLTLIFALCIVLSPCSGGRPIWAQELPPDMPPPLPPRKTYDPPGIQGKSPCPEGQHIASEDGPCVPFTEPHNFLEDTGVAGMPFTQAKDIFDRQVQILIRIPGVRSVALEPEGIIIQTEGNPLLIPHEVEGLPIIIKDYSPLRLLSHSFYNKLSPVRGGYSVTDEADTVLGTLTGVTLSKGHPWFIFAAHNILKTNPSTGAPWCRSSPPNSNCWTGGSLGNCPRTTNAPDHIYQQQLVTPGLNTQIGYVQKWVATPNSQSIYTSDTAAAYADNNITELDGSLPVDNVIDGYGTLQGFANPVQGEAVTILTAGVGTPALHVKTGHVMTTAQVDCFGNPSGNSDDFTACVNGYPCWPDPTLHGSRHQFIVQMDAGNCTSSGDSGSPVLNSAGKIIGMVNWGNGLCQTGGTRSDEIKNHIGFDSWLDANATNLSATLDFPIQYKPVGQAACTWVHVKNIGVVTAQNVALLNMDNSSPAPTFDYQNPAGQWNTPYPISLGQTAQFALCMNYSAGSLDQKLYRIDFYGTNAVGALIKIAENSMTATWSNTSGPNVMVFTATPSGDDVLHTNGVWGGGALGLSASNFGPTGPVTVTMDTNLNGVNQPYTLSGCETTNANPPGSCITPLSSSWTIPSWTNGAVKTFSVFAAGQGQAVTLDPYYHRLYFYLHNGSNSQTGPLVGGVSVAVTTQ
jgi:hypothetical protein